MERKRARPIERAPPAGFMSRDYGALKARRGIRLGRLARDMSSASAGENERKVEEKRQILTRAARRKGGKLTLSRTLVLHVFQNS